MMIHYLAIGFNFTLSISLSISPVDFCALSEILKRSSILCSCKLALLAICGVGGGSGGGGGTDGDSTSSALLDKDARDASTRQKCKNLRSSINNFLSR